MPSPLYGNKLYGGEETTIEKYLSTESHSKKSVSFNHRIIDFDKVVNSHAVQSSSSMRSLIQLNAKASSFSNTISSDVDTIVKIYSYVDSHGRPCATFCYTERTSLELIDYSITWDDKDTEWITNWFQESKILGSEDTLAIRSLIVDEAKDPAARVVVDYNENGNDSVDATSEPIELGSDAKVYDVVGVPVDPDGYYRIRITDYSGYNSIYSIDMGIIH